MKNIALVGSALVFVIGLMCVVDYDTWVHVQEGRMSLCGTECSTGVIEEVIIHATEMGKTCKVKHIVDTNIYSDVSFCNGSDAGQVDLKHLVKYIN